MIGYAVSGDTWGISGPTFVLFLLAAGVVITIGTLVHRRLLFAGPDAVRLGELQPQEAAYLNGGERLAVYASLGALRVDGAVGMTPDGALQQSGSMPTGATPLDQAVYHAAGNRVRPKALTGDQWVRAAVDQLREGLERSGLAASAQDRKATRKGPLLLFALVAVAVARLYAGIANGRPVGFLILIGMVTGAVALILFVRVPRHTRAAETALAKLRQRHMYLAPSHVPAYATYGAIGAAMGVALFGTASLWAMDPAFASEAEIEREALNNAGYYSTGSSGTAGASCGGSSSGGGGGCGGGGGGGCGG